MLITISFLLALASSVYADRRDRRDPRDREGWYQGPGGHYTNEVFNDPTPPRNPHVPRDWSEIPQWVKDKMSDAEYPKNQKEMAEYVEKYRSDLAEDRKSVGTYNPQDFENHRGVYRDINEIACKKRGLEGDACRLRQREENQQEENQQEEKQQEGNPQEERGERESNQGESESTRRNDDRGRGKDSRERKQPRGNNGRLRGKDGRFRKQPLRGKDGRFRKQQGGRLRGKDGRFRKQQGKGVRRPPPGKSGCRRGSDGRFRLSNGRLCKKPQGVKGKLTGKFRGKFKGKGKGKFGGFFKKGSRKPTAGKASRKTGGFFGALKKVGGAAKKAGSRCRRGRLPNGRPCRR
jgi:hypothetical protein